MAIPDYQTLMRPVLKMAQDGQAHRLRDAIDRMEQEFDFTEVKRKEFLPSGSLSFSIIREPERKEMLRKTSEAYYRLVLILRLKSRGKTPSQGRIQSPASVTVGQNVN